MLELRLKKPKEMELREMDSLPFPSEDEVKIRVIYGGICGSDVGVYQGKLQHAKYPVRPGHELVGKVIEAGRNASIPVGTRVVILPNTFCGECSYCLNGDTNICLHKKSLGVNVDGGFSQEVIISSKYVLAIPDDLPNEKAVLIEPLAVVVHAFRKVIIEKETSVCIVGCGNEGMLAAALAHHLGARVTAIDINPHKLELVKKIGNIHTILTEYSGNETFDIVIEAGGTKSSVEQAIRRVRPGGAMVVIGLAHEAIFPVAHMVRNELTLYGTIIYNFPSDYLQTIEYLRDPTFHVDSIVSSIMPFTSFQQAFENALSGNYGKIILDFKEA
ncbi:alcohol dehydrogenase catalytic domain-containing protein [Brevibacillus nitrificans]|uniref:zinc-dependent alcohol dehydrogenase n=1 Tax=Brevibacillus nitrificans TaxID=651560 RepID=UPI00286B8EDF|nr:alcohol dehydrogenase catalytic domain-containing protein [Brevibacillus nitrificans]